MENEEIISRNNNELKIIYRKEKKYIKFKHTDFFFGNDIYSIALNNIITKYSIDCVDREPKNIKKYIYCLTHYFSSDDEYNKACKIINSFHLNLYYTI
jgi:hypothetical protein